MNKTGGRHRFPRKEHQNRVACLNSPLDRKFPILTPDQILLVKPGLYAPLKKVAPHFANCYLVPLRMAQEDFERCFRESNGPVHKVMEISPKTLLELVERFDAERASSEEPHHGGHWLIHLRLEFVIQHRPPRPNRSLHNSISVEMVVI